MRWMQRDNSTLRAESAGNDEGQPFDEVGHAIKLQWPVPKKLLLSLHSSLIDPFEWQRVKQMARDLGQVVS